MNPNDPRIHPTYQTQQLAHQESTHSDAVNTVCYNSGVQLVLQIGQQNPGRCCQMLLVGSQSCLRGIVGRFRPMSADLATPGLLTGSCCRI